MNDQTGLSKLWAGLDNLLLSAVFILLGLVWYSGRTNTVPSATSRRASEQPKETVRRPASAGVVDGTRVFSGQASMRMIARSMADTDWDRVPPTPAMDMREQGKAYEVTFPLPEHVDRDSVRVTVAGNVLTLTMKNGDTGNIFMQRVRIPCTGDNTEKLQTLLTNNVLRIRISPSGG